MIQVENLPSNLASKPLMKQTTPPAGPVSGTIPSALLHVDLSALAAGEKWEEALRANDFDAALVEIESSLNTEPSSGGAQSASNRLWWARCQLATNRVPLSALTAPVDEILPAIKKEAKLQLLGCSTLALLSAKLSERGQTRLALVMLENAFDLAALSESISAETHRELGAAFAAAIDAELVKVEGKKDPKGYVASLKSKRDAISARVKRPVPKKLREAPEEDHRSFVWGEKEFPASGGETALSIPAAPSKAEPQFAAQARATGEQKRIPLVSIIAAVVVVLTILGSWDSVFSRRSGEESAEAGFILAMNTPLLGSPESAVRLPMLSPRSADAIFQKIGALGSNLDVVGERLKNIGGAKAEPRTAEEIRSDPDVDTAALEGKEGKALRLAKATPKQDDELESFGGPKAEPTLSAERAPLLNPDRLASLPVESVGSSPYRAPIEPEPPAAGLPPARQLPPANGGRDPGADLRVGPDGRIYGPPRDANGPLMTREEGTSIDGQPVRSYEVQRYPSPVLFKTIASTQVLSAPSFLATSLVRLAPDTSIQVVSRMGQWLELRSTEGNRGFILAQDAQEVR